MVYCTARLSDPVLDRVVFRWGYYFMDGDHKYLFISLCAHQDDRGQEVVDSGPYHFIRHPMYLGIIILFLCLGPALGSLYALIPGVLIDVLYLIRTAKEDQMLQKELAGYQDYAEKVRYRLLPGIW